MGSSGPVVVLYMLPFAVAMVLLAIRLWQAATSPDSQGRTLQLAGVLAAASLLATAPWSIRHLSAWLRGAGTDHPGTRRRRHRRFL